MGLLTGAATFSRFRVSGPAPSMFGPEHLRALDNESISAIAENTAGPFVGWSAGDHIMDTVFEFQKNVIEDTLSVQLCIETNTPPAERLKSYYQQDLIALAKNNPSGFPSALNKREAKEAAQDRIEQEAKDGRFIRRKVVDVMWDLKTSEVWFGSTSSGHATHLRVLFKNTFGIELEPITAGEQARHTAEMDIEADAVEAATLSPFIGTKTPQECSWTVAADDRDFVGNEFLLWLWFQCDDDSATITLSDASKATVFLSKTLTLECPTGMGGKEVFTHEGPTRLSEAMQAIRSGKLPRRSGMIIVRHNTQYELVLGAETFAITGAKIPKPEEDGLDNHGRRQARVDGLRSLMEAIDLLYLAFCRQRFSEAWGEQLPRMQAWLAREERRAA
jgi:hypothetical protein